MTYQTLAEDLLLAPLSHLVSRFDYFLYVAPLHAAFIRCAAHTPTGAVRKGTNFRRSHSPGLYLYAKSFVHENSAITSNSEDKVLGSKENWSFHEELPFDEPLVEGASIIVKVNAFERNPIARQRCIDHYGNTCAVCDFNFREAYGSAVDGYIHIHHLWLTRIDIESLRC